MMSCFSRPPSSALGVRVNSIDGSVLACGERHPLSKAPATARIVRRRMPPGCRSIAKEKSSLRVVDLHGTSPTNGETFIDSQEVTDMLMATKSNPVARINTSIWCRGPVECDAEWSGHHACSGNRSLRGPCASLLHARGFGEGAQRIEK